MNKFFAITLILLGLAIIGQCQTSIGGYRKVNYIEDEHKEILKTALSHLTSSNLLTSNSAAKLEAIFVKIVSGLNYKLIISEGSNFFEIQIWSQPWENKLEVIKSERISQ